MKNIPSTRRRVPFFAGVLSLLVLSTPVVTSAQTATSFRHQDGSSETSTVRRERIRGYRQQSSEMQAKIQALGSVAVMKFPIPILSGVSLSDISPNFGDPRSGGRTHEGEDIMAVKGTPIVSPTDAVVLRTGTGSTEGNYVYTANPGGEIFVYMHLDRVGEGVVPGLVLKTGDLIGYVGNTGNASGGAAHLHFEVHTAANVPVDPFPRLVDRVKIPSDIDTSTRSGSVTLVLSRNLTIGMTGDDVRALQQLLNARGFTVAVSGAGSPGNETSYFGPATRAAVARLQAAGNIAPAVGYVGPITRAALAAG
jgi:hypothetical protein